MNKAGKTYLIEFGGAMALYTVVIVVTSLLLKNIASANLRLLVSLLPKFPIGLGLLAFLRFFRAMDELQKRIQLDALAFAFGASGLLTFSYGLMQFAGMPQISLVFIFPLMIALWGLGSIMATRRYQ